MFYTYTGGVKLIRPKRVVKTLSRVRYISIIKLLLLTYYNIDISSIIRASNLLQWY